MARILQYWSDTPQFAGYAELLEGECKAQPGWFPRRTFARQQSPSSSSA